MKKNLQTITFPNLIPNFWQRNFKSKEIAQDIYENFLTPHLKKYLLAQNAHTELKNILHINTAAGKGGAAKVAYEFLNGNFNSLGYNSRMLVATNYTDDNDTILTLKTQNMPLHKMLHRYSRKNGMLDFYNLESFNIPEIQAFNDADVINLHNIHGAYFSIFMLPLLTSLKPTIWTLHDEQAFTGHCSYSFECGKWLDGCGNCPDLNYYPKIKKDTTKFLLDLKKKIYDASEFTVVCPSEWLAGRVRRSVLGDKDVRVIYNCVKTDVFKLADKNQARNELKLPPDKKILMFSASGGFKNPQKGGKYLLDVYNMLKKRDDLLFLNIGGNSNNKNPNWLDIPYIKDESLMAKYYSAADLFIYPSLVESFGLVVAEALSCGTPVVAFNTSALPEIIEHGRTGYLAHYKDVDDFINGINTFLNNDELRLSAGKEGRSKVLSNFTVEKTVNGYLNLYKEAINVRTNEVRKV